MIMRHGDEKAVDITVLTPIGPWGFNIIYIYIYRYYGDVTAIYPQKTWRHFVVTGDITSIIIYRGSTRFRHNDGDKTTT